MRYLKDHWPQLLLSMLGSVLSSAFALGCAMATLGNRVADAERRLDELDKSAVPETHWQVAQNTNSLGAMQSDARQTQTSIALINTRLGVIDAKLDAIAEAVKSK
jgi:hypothetical protein